MASLGCRKMEPGASTWHRTWPDTLADSQQSGHCSSRLGPEKCGQHPWQRCWVPNNTHPGKTPQHVRLELQSASRSLQGLHTRPLVDTEHEPWK